jgi:oligo-1,6-glucosidase
LAFVCHLAAAGAPLTARAGQVGRDNARTPMQWDSSPNAGFTSGQPWHRVHDNYRHVNVAEELANPDGVLHFYRRILALRKQHKDLFVYGRFRLLDAENPCTFTFAKEAPGQRAVVALNFMPTPQPFAPPPGIKMALSTATAGEGQADVLQPLEGRLYLSL